MNFILEMFMSFFNIFGVFGSNSSDDTDDNTNEDSDDNVDNDDGVSEDTTDDGVGDDETNDNLVIETHALDSGGEVVVTYDPHAEPNAEWLEADLTVTHTSEEGEITTLYELEDYDLHNQSIVFDVIELESGDFLLEEKAEYAAWNDRTVTIYDENAEMQGSFSQNELIGLPEDEANSGTWVDGTLAGYNANVHRSSYLAHEEGGFTAAATNVWIGEDDENHFHDTLLTISYAQYDEDGQQIGDTISMSYQDVFGDEYESPDTTERMRFDINDDGGITVMDADIERYVTFDNVGEVLENGAYIRELDTDAEEWNETFTPDEDVAEEETLAMVDKVALLMSGEIINEEPEKVEPLDDEEFDIF